MLKNNSSRHRRRVWLTILASSVFSVGGLFISRASLAADVEAALKEATKAVDTAKTATTKVDEAKTKIVETNKNQKAEDVTWKAWTDLTKFLKTNIEKTLKDHKESVPALTTQKANLEKIRKELESTQRKARRH